MSKVGMSKQSLLFDCLLRFWSPSSNAFLFSWGPMSSTLYDIYLFTGLPLIGHDSPYLIDDSSAPELAAPRYCFPSCRAVVKQYESCSGEPSTIEHIMFLWVLICQYIFCPISGKPSTEYLPLACSLRTGRVYNLGAMLLGSFYKGMNSCVVNNPQSRLGGVAWFLQLWAAAYFSQLFSFPDSSAPLTTITLMQGRFDLFDVEFTVFLQAKYFSDLTPPSKPHTGSFSQPWITAHPLFRDESKELILDILFTACVHHRFLIVDCVGGRPSAVARANVGWTFEFYNPALFARQFGLSQIVPHSVLFYPSDLSHLYSEIDDGRLSRATVDLFSALPSHFRSPIRVCTSEEANPFPAWWASRRTVLAPAFNHPSGILYHLFTLLATLLVLILSCPCSQEQEVCCSC
ncbi:hypothetical protein F511_37033 [Dorcoceras hygrometricum]|uniref:Aminotransferase-like plant mobile domain-containing protein n=1 Tax=Dorcoceras hygrometricum TaxID=472368 RepID=A0A2Z7AC52_9LAMI|nr:hypothetical protein F511_37033 [Dorcoceras hygrometricum]